MTKPEKFTVKTYEIIQLIPANGAKAVFIDDRDDGSAVLIASDLHFVALADTIETKRQRTEGVRSVVIGMAKPGRDIIGIQFLDGWETIVNEDSHFAGLMMPGQDIGDCTGCANPELLDKVKATAMRMASIN